MRYSRLLATALLWLSLVAPALAQSVVPVQMRDANLTTTNTQNLITTQNTFSAPRTLTVPDRSSINSYYLQFVDTANAVNGANTLTIAASGGNLINGSATLVVSSPGAYIILTPSGTGYKASTFFTMTAPSAVVGGSTTQVQYNNAGVLGGISGATSNGTTLTLVAPVLGTPASGTLTNTTGYTVANLAGAGAGCLTWIATPSSANLRGCITDETGTGLAYFQGGALGTPASGVATNLTSIPFTVVKQSFTVSGTYTPTANMKYAIIEVCGGGGAGGGSSGTAANYYAGGGGGAGGYSRLVATAATIGASKSVTIGAAGTGSSNAAGGAGGRTCVGAAACAATILVSANGGAGGTQGNTSTVPTGGAGGAADTGDITTAGQGGNTGIYATTAATLAASGFGGNSFFGGGASGVLAANAASSAGTAAGAICSGGSGGSSNNIAGSPVAGGAGSAGFVFITEFVLP